MVTSVKSIIFTREDCLLLKCIQKHLCDLIIHLNAIYTYAKMDYQPWFAHQLLNDISLLF